MENDDNIHDFLDKQFINFSSNYTYKLKIGITVKEIIHDFFKRFNQYKLDKNYLNKQIIDSFIEKQIPIIEETCQKIKKSLHETSL